MSAVQQGAATSFTGTETIYQVADSPGEYRIVRRSDSRFMDIEYRPTAWPFLGRWQRLDHTDLTEKAMSIIESHARQQRDRMEQTS